MIGLLIGQRWYCPLSGKQWLIIDSFVEGASAIPNVKRRTADLAALLARRRDDGECVGRYCGTTLTDAQLPGMSAAVHVVTVKNPGRRRSSWRMAAAPARSFSTMRSNSRWF